MPTLYRRKVLQRSLINRFLCKAFFDKKLSMFQLIFKGGFIMAVIKVENLSKTFKVKVKEKGLKGSLKSIFKPKYENVKAVNDVSFEVNEGEVIAFIGPNGAGKSTTIKMLTGILYPDNGNINVLGLDPRKERKKLAYKIGTVFGQKEQLWMHLTPFDNFKFFAAIYDIPEKKAEEKINELTELFGLEKFINIPVRNLSLGQRIRCEIVASLIHEPKILFLDEPTIGLDPVVKENIRTLIKKMNKELKTTIFLTSHDVSDIEKLCKRVIIINNGEVVLNDSMTNLKYHYLNKKIVEAKLEKSVKFDEIKGILVLKNSGGNLKLEIDTSIISPAEVIEAIGLDNIKDINILNTPLENIIKDIYREEKAK